MENALDVEEGQSRHLNSNQGQKGAASENRRPVKERRKGYFVNDDPGGSEEAFLYDTL